MLKFAVLVLKNLGRNKVRTTLTCLAVVVLVAIYCVVQSITGFFDDMLGDSASQTRLIVSERWTMPSRFPARYVSQIAEMPGVQDWTVWYFHRGYFDASRQNNRRGTGVATRPENLVAMHPGLESLDPAAVEAMQREPTAALVGPHIMEMMKWRLGQRFTILSLREGGPSLELMVVGVLPPGRWARNFFFREDYYRKATGNEDTVALMWLRVADLASGKRLAAEIERRFTNHQPELRVETESAGIARFTGRNQAVVALINVVVFILLVDMVVVLSNSIGITTRDRRTEMAVLKVLGFQAGHIMVLVVGEAMLVGAISGGLGAALVYGLSYLNEQQALPFSIGFMSQFPVPPRYVPYGVAIGAGIGLLGSLLPAWNARNVRISDVFARIA